MARKKVSQTTENLEDYNKYMVGFKYFEQVIGLKENYGIEIPKELKRPTKASVKNIKKEWKKLRGKLQEDKWEVPSITEINKYYENRETPVAREPINLGYEFIQGFINHLTAVYQDAHDRTPDGVHTNFMSFAMITSIEEAYQICLQSIDELVLKLGYDAAADKIQNHPDYQATQTNYFDKLYNINEYFNFCVDFFESMLDSID